MTETTVKVHVREIMRKLGVSNRTQVAIAAAQSARTTHRTGSRGFIHGGQAVDLSLAMNFGAVSRAHCAILCEIIEHPISSTMQYVGADPEDHRH